MLEATALAVAMIRAPAWLPAQGNAVGKGLEILKGRVIDTARMGPGARG